ncbi:MAG: sterol desaturase family protein [Cyanobacteria bacterium J06632_3]
MTVLGYVFISGSLYGFFFRKRTQVAIDYAAQSLESRRVGEERVVEGWRDRVKRIWADIRHDVMLSVWSSAIFAVCASAMTTAYVLGYTRLYLDPEQHGLWYTFFSLCLVIFLQDTYFYFTHRLAHHPKCYRWLHRGHHRSNNPTPFTAFSFDPGEALLQAIYLMAAVCLIPMHISVLCAVVLVMSLGALIHHFSLRMFSDSAFGRWLGSWMVGPMHHWFHHRKYTVHYGLYFTFWDKLLGTHHHGYEAVLDAENADQHQQAVTVFLSTHQSKSSGQSDSSTIQFPTPLKKAS